MQGAVHMVAVRLGIEKAMVGTWRATPYPDCMDRLRKHYSHLAEGWFLARKAAWALNGSQSLERNGDRCVKGMCELKVV